MYNKKIICIDDGRLVALKFSEETGLCVVGGQESARELLANLLKDYFGFTEDTLPKFRVVTNTKGKYVFETTWDKYIEAVAAMRRDNFTVRDVKNHGKLMG